MDLLSRTLCAIKVSATSISHWQLGAPWGVEVLDFQPGFCLLIAEGGAYVSNEHLGQRFLESGDILFAPNGANCRIQSALDAACFALDDLPWTGPGFEALTRMTQPETPMEVVLPGAGETTRIYGFAFSLEGTSHRSFLPQLPPVIVFDRPGIGVRNALKSFVSAMITEPAPGYVSIANHLVQFAVLTLLREYLLHCGSEMSGWARSIHDKKIFNLISAIHAAPHQEWSLAQMARQTHLSRSSFYRRFQDAVGDTPMNYVLEARVNAAAELLAITEKPIERIAMEAGFKSSRTLRLAFAQRYQISPAQYRRQLRIKAGR